MSKHIWTKENPNPEKKLHGLRNHQTHLHNLYATQRKFQKDYSRFSSLYWLDVLHEISWLTFFTALASPWCQFLDGLRLNQDKKNTEYTRKATILLHEVFSSCICHVLLISDWLQFCFCLFYYQTSLNKLVVLLCVSFFFFHTCVML